MNKYFPAKLSSDLAGFARSGREGVVVSMRFDKYIYMHPRGSGDIYVHASSLAFWLSDADQPLRRGECLLTLHHFGDLFVVRSISHTTIQGGGLLLGFQRNRSLVPSAVCSTTVHARWMRSHRSCSSWSNICLPGVGGYVAGVFGPTLLSDGSRVETLGDWVTTYVFFLCLVWVDVLFFQT